MIFIKSKNSDKRQISATRLDVFAEGGTPDTAYVADIYEHVSFLGDLHQQLSASPDGSKVRLRVASKPSPKSW
jgi:hypothetical protein